MGRNNYMNRRPVWAKKKQDKTFMNLITRRLVEFWCPIFKVNVLSSFSICCFGSYVIDQRLLFYFSFKFLSENKVKTNSKQITFYPMQSVNWCNKRLIKYLENTQHTKMRLGTLRVLKTGNSQIKPLLIINWTEFNSSYTFFFPPTILRLREKGSCYHKKKSWD